jgi:DNA-binding SARP family transcriptional activator/predicted ATPase
MPALELRFLGEPEVIREGAAQSLPPSKKTRALLAYLALNERAFHREHLCSLLWEVPDDPRGSLRWSLSKLRRLVDEDGCARIVTDGNLVGFDAKGVTIDWRELHAVAAGDLAATSIDVLERAAKHYRGNFLEGMELSSFHGFHSWCIAERELAARAQAQVLRALVGKLAGSPDRAARYARAATNLDPYDEPARATLIRLLLSLGHTDEAEQQFRLGLRILEEAGVKPSHELLSSWQGTARVRTPAVKGASSTRPSVARTLIGRAEEIARLNAELTRTIEARAARVVVLRGVAGIGKSTLLDALAPVARAAGALVLTACAAEARSKRPFALWTDAFSGDAEDRPALFSDGTPENRNRLFDDMSARVASLTQSRPLVLSFDDMQWCDESSVVALDHVVRTNARAPLLALLAVRDDEARDNVPMQHLMRSLRRQKVLVELIVPPLGEEELAALAASAAPEIDPVPLAKASNGNPLLALELARAVAAGDHGNSLDELVRERLARCDVDTTEVLRWAALLSPRLDMPTLTKLCGMDANRIGLALETAERQSLLQVAERGLRFPHDLIARSIYADTSPARRRVMHRRVAELLEQDTALDLQIAADLAHHAASSGDPALEARAMVAAARLCLRFFANDDAQLFARNGLLVAGDLPERERVCMTLELHDVMLAAAPTRDWEQAADEFVELAEAALDHGAVAHARLGYHMASYLRWAHGQWAQAREEALQAERVTRAGADEDHIIGMAEAAKCLAMLERDLSQADAMLMEARSLAMRKRLNPAAIPAALGMLRFHESKLDEAESLFKEARTLCKSNGDRLNEFQAHEYLVMIELERDRPQAARQHCSALLKLGARLRDGSEAPFARSLDALCRYALDDDASDLEPCLDELRDTDAKYRLAYVLTRTAEIDLARGRVKSARERAEEALRCAAILERPTETLLARVILAEAAAADDDPVSYAIHRSAIDALADARVARRARDRAHALIADER